MEGSGPPRRGSFVGIARLAAVAVVLLFASTPPARAEFKLVGEIGAPGAGELQLPIDVDRDAVGNTYVADAYAHGVIVYDSANNFVRKIGSRGTGPGQFEFPFAIGVNEATGETYVADLNEGNPTLNVRIERFDALGNFLGEFGSFGTAEGQFGLLRGIAVQPGTGDVFVADENRVQRFSSTGAFELMWGADVTPGGGTGAETCAANCKQGEPGDAEGELAFASGIAVTATSAYVAENGNQRVSRFNPATGAFIAMAGRDVQPGGAQVGEICVAACQAGLPGNGPLEFAETQGIGVDTGLGRVYVVDENNSRVQRLAANLNYASEFGAAGTGDGEFVNPRAVGVGGGSVVVTDIGLPRAQTFFGLGAFKARFGDPQPGSVAFPTGLGVGPGGVYVTDRLDRTLRFDPLGAFVARFGSSGAPPGEGFTLGGVGVAPNGEVYVTDRFNDQIRRFDASGAQLGAWGTTGIGDGQFDDPIDVAVGPDGTVYALDGGTNARIQKFSPIGAFLGTWGAPGEELGQFGVAQGIGTDAKGNVYVADTSNDRIQKFSGEGTLLTAWGAEGTGDGQFDGPTDVAVDGAGNVYVTDRGNNRVERFTTDGEFRGAFGSPGGAPGSGPGEFDSPSAIALDAAGYIYAVEVFNSRVQKFAATPELKLKGKKRQKLAKLKVKAVCQSGPCDTIVRATGKVGSVKLKFKPNRKSIGVDAPKQLKLKLKGKRTARRAAALLADGAAAKLTVKAKAFNEAGTAKAKRKLKLR